MSGVVRILLPGPADAGWCVSTWRSLSVGNQRPGLPGTRRRLGVRAVAGAVGLRLPAEPAPSSAVVVAACPDVQLARGAAQLGASHRTLLGRGPQRRDLGL